MASTACARRGVETAVVNVHYLAEQIEAWAARQTAPHIIISDERAEILDTGGGVAQALPLLGESPSSSSTATASGWTRASPRLIACARRGTMTAMDCLLLLCPLDRTVGYDGTGDFVRGAGWPAHAGSRPPKASRWPISAAISFRPACSMAHQKASSR